MAFLGIYKAIYDYAPQSEGELQISEGDLLYVLDKNGDDDWWKAKKKAGGDEEDEPVGLIPNNYIEEAPPVGYARALYEYTRQTDEELSFPEDAALQVFDTSDPDWILVGLDDEYGFVPSNYIDMSAADAEDSRQASDPEPEPTPPLPPALPSRPIIESRDSSGSAARGPSSPPGAGSPAQNPAAALASVMGARASARVPASPISPRSPQNETPTPEASDDEEVRSPALPARPKAPIAAAPRVVRYEEPPLSPDDSGPPRAAQLTPGGFHMYNINEMVSVMGKRKKMPTTLGINLSTGTILIAPERTQDGPSQEWTADKMTHYSREGKHVFLELVRPSKSVDFHAGAKDTAEEIVSALGELAGAVRAEGLREVIMAGTGQSQKRGQVLYDFMAQGDDEVTVGVGDEVIVLDDTKSQEWWQVRRLKNGKEGVVPSSYIEVTGTVTPPPPSVGLNSARSTVEQNRLEEIRLTKEAVKAANQRDGAQQVGPGMPLPERGSSLTARENGNNSGQQRSRRENGQADRGSGGGGGQAKPSKSKPDSSKLRTWTDRSKSFSVEAQFLGVKDGKLNLHKLNGVKIAVPINKMSLEDLEYVEKVTGMPVAENKPSKKQHKPTGEPVTPKEPRSGVGATIEQPRKPEYDWFQFFLSCDVAVGLCERYAQSFAKDSMDESVLPDVDAAVLRNLGLREGDIIKVMRTLDAKYGRTNKGKRNAGGDSADGEEAATGGLFSGPGGALRNNTRKGRPAPAVTTSDVVDAKTFTQKDGEASTKSPTSPTAPVAPRRGAGGFDDDAWDVKPAKQHPQPQPAPAAKEPEPAPAPAQPARPPASLSGSIQELSLLSAPLEPAKAEPPRAPEPALQLPPATTSPAPVQQPQPTGATPSFFAGVAAQAIGAPESAMAHPAGIVSGPLGSIQAARHRPAAPQFAQGGAASLMAPPPSRPLSAPQSAQPSAFTPPPGVPMMVPQMTGVHPTLQGQPAPPGRSLNDMATVRLQQQYAMQQMQAQPTGMNAYGMPGQPQAMVSFPTGVPQQHPGFMQPMMTGIQPVQSPFADPIRPQQFSPLQQIPAQATGFPGQFSGLQQQQFGQGPPPGSVNNYLPPPLVPERTGMPAAPFQAPAPTGFNAIGAPPMAPPAPQPLVPQQTGPAPAIRFGVTTGPKPLAPQPTGRRANLAAATPQNPFGF